jgi:hypothetical protein
VDGAQDPRGDPRPPATLIRASAERQRAACERVIARAKETRRLDTVMVSFGVLLALAPWRGELPVADVAALFISVLELLGTPLAGPGLSL